MDRTEATIRKLLAALPAPGYDLGILSERGMYRLEAVPESRILRMLPYLKYRNANGAHIYIRPTGESAYTLLDDLTAATLARLAPEGYAPPPWSKQAPAASRHGFATRSRFPRSLAPLPQRPLPSSSAQTAAPPTGAGSDAPPASPTASRSTASLRASTRSPVSSVTPASRCQAQPFRVQTLTPSRRRPKQERAALRLSFAARPSRFPVSLHSRASARRPATRAGQPPQIWRSASPPVLRDGPSPTLPPRYRRDYLSRDQAKLARTAYIRRTLAQSAYVGLPSSHRPQPPPRAFRAAGRNPCGFSLHPHPPFRPPLAGCAPEVKFLLLDSPLALPSSKW